MKIKLLVLTLIILTLIGIAYLVWSSWEELTWLTIGGILIVILWAVSFPKITGMSYRKHFDSLFN